MSYEEHVNRRVNLQLSLEEARATQRRLEGFSGDSNLLETERAVISQCLGSLQAIADRLAAELAATEDPEGSS